MKLFQNYPISIYNSISGTKEPFNTNIEGKVGMYVCGPTVYSNVHLGNVRTFLSFDFIYRALKHLGYQVRYVRNITDAGHLTDDGNVENDRFVKQSRLEQLEPMEVVQKYTVDFHHVLQEFNLLPPTIEPTATGHIVEQIELTQKLIDKGFAYESNGSVYFDVNFYNQKGLQYGELSKRNIEELLSNTRDLDGQNEKKNPQDFALWKKASPAHIMRWNSPWSEGFPGWHLECTAMSTKYLGENFDIHGGGMDLKFPHHECEIAQGKACNDTKPVNYWMHTNMLTLNGQRMSKSTGNYILPLELISGENSFIEKPISPNVARFFFLQTHYRSTLDISNDAIIAAEKGLNRLQETFSIFNQITASESSSISVQNWIDETYKVLTDDFNAPMLIAQLFEASKIVNAIKNETETLTENDISDLKHTFTAMYEDVLGLTQTSKEFSSTSLDAAMQVLISLRNEARIQKNWKLSDDIRDKLLEQNIQLKDGKEGTTYEILN